MIKTLESHDPILQAAREMRRNQTPAENALWAALRGRQFSGLRSYRQRVIGPLIVDFYCAAARLVIEIDGDIHDYQIGYDEARTQHLEDYGYKVIRFKNEMALNDLETVLNRIKDAALERISYLTPNPSPGFRRGESAPVTLFPGGEEPAPLPLNSGEGAGG